jgi:hypothetical protein
VSLGKDTCFTLLDVNGKSIDATRKMEIIENTLDDSALLGFSVISPDYLGSFNYLQKDSSLIYPEMPERYWPKTNTICVHQYNKKPVQGKLVIKYYY